MSVVGGHTRKQMWEPTWHLQGIVNSICGAKEPWGGGQGREDESREVGRDQIMRH